MDCTQNTDPLKLVRDGTSQDQRNNPALDPAHAPVDERLPEHSMVFARAFARYLNYYNSSDTASGDWQAFFASDVSVQLAVMAVQDVAGYKTQIKAYLDFLNNRDHQGDETTLKQRLGYLFGSVASVAKYLDALTQTLPTPLPLNATVQNLITSQLATAFRRLIAYYQADLAAPVRVIADVHPDLLILGQPAVAFKTVYDEGLSVGWITDDAADWTAYKAGIGTDATGFGSGPTVFDRTNHLATHNLFTAVLDQFLKAYARLVVDAKAALTDTFTKQDDHEPHYALFLAFLRLREYARQETNTLTKRHLDFYYRDVLRLREKPAEPAHAHVLLELAKHVETHLLPPGELFKAGKDGTGKPVFFANDRDFVANRAVVAALKTLYRHGDEPVGDEPTIVSQQKGRLYASPVANSDDGAGAVLTSVDQSWHPFFNKQYSNGTLGAIQMPMADVGFAIASHYLWMAEGTRTITVSLTVGSFGNAVSGDFTSAVTCSLSGEKGWIDKPPTRFTLDKATGQVQLEVQLTGADPAVTPYSAKIHGFTLTTDLPVLLVRLNQQVDIAYSYPKLEDIMVQSITLTVVVMGLKTLGVSNDFGPVDTAKPFQPFGAQPVANSSLTVGSREVFQKNAAATLNIDWLNSPAYYKSTAPKLISSMPKTSFNLLIDKQLEAITTPITGIETAIGSIIQGNISPEPQISIASLVNGQWGRTAGYSPITTAASFAFRAQSAGRNVEFSPTEPYTSASAQGYVRLTLTDDLGFDQYQIDLVNYLTSKDPKPPAHPGLPILGPSISRLTVDYTAGQTIDLATTADPAAFPNREAHFFHLAPFGQAEQHPYLKQQPPALADPAIYLLPPFGHRNTTDDNLPDQAWVRHEAEFYIGLTDLQPPQSLALLLQVADGTADPQVVKPNPHLHWSYLSRNEWVSFTPDAVDDATGGLIRSGIVTLAVPREASAANTLLPASMHWVRVAVAGKSEAVCRLLSVVAQAARVTFTDRGNDPALPATVLPAGTITKLDQPTAAVKQVTQPFATFGGRGREASAAFYTRVSERLRHKDRAIALWDYERLILDAFPAIYRVKCLNHTEFRPGTYRELAPGHVTIVTIPNQQFPNQRDPLRPYTSLGLLAEIETFVAKRTSCFVKLHVRNPEFEPVRVSFKVRFYPGFDETFYTRMLREAIVRFLSPWAFPGGSSPSFGGKIYKSVLINFVEDQPYVDYVTEVVLFHAPTRDRDPEEIVGSKAVSILVSVPADGHDIRLIKPAERESPAGQCLCDV